MSETNASTPPRGFWIVSVVALIWNLIGIMTYLMSVMITPETLAAMSAAERALYTDIPAWVTAAYAIAVFGGTAGCIALLMRKALAVPIFMVALIAVLAQMGHALFLTAMLEVRGYAAAVLPLLIVAIGIYLLLYSRAAKRKGLLH